MQAQKTLKCNITEVGQTTIINLLSSSFISFIKLCKAAVPKSEVIL